MFVRASWYKRREGNQLDATEWFIALVICSTCFGHLYAHHQELETILVFISVFNQLDAQNLFHNKFYFMPLHVSSICVHHQEVKIVLHSPWYHKTYRWPSRARVG